MENERAKGSSIATLLFFRRHHVGVKPSNPLRTKKARQCAAVQVVLPGTLDGYTSSPRQRFENTTLRKYKSHPRERFEDNILHS